MALHGGSLEAESDGPGLGSTFIVRMPMRAGPRPRLAPPLSGHRAAPDDALACW